MKTIADIRRAPTIVRQVRVAVGVDQYRLEDIHESVLRSYQILERVRWLLSEGSSSAVVLQEIAEMQA